MIGKIAGVAKRVAADLLELLGVTVDGVYTPPSGGTANRGATHMLAEGLVLKTTSSSGGSLSFKRLAVADENDNVLVYNGGSTGSWSKGTIGASSNSTKYYLYWLYNSSTVLTGLKASTVSVRNGGTYTIPSGFTHYREIGELYVDSSGGIVAFKRVGDRVTFTEDVDETSMFSDDSLTATFVERSYPAAAPLRAEWVEFVLRQRSGTLGRMNMVVADNSSGDNQAFLTSYTTGTSNTYDGSDHSNKVGTVPSDSLLSAARAWVRGHWTFSSAAKYDMWLAAYVWRI